MKKAVMYGAGNIGRGFLGQLFCMSGYETVFIDVNETIVNKLNEDKQYPIYIAKNDRYEVYTVKNVRAVSGANVSAVANEIATADIAATAVGVNALPFIAAPLAQGIRARYAKGGAPLNIIICENKIGADEYLRELISKKLTDDDKDYFNNGIGLIEASVGRMVPVTPKDISDANCLAVCTEEYCQLPVDKDAFKGDIPELNNMVLFSPFEFYIQRKLFMHNMSHAFTAYLGNVLEYEYIWQAQCDPHIKLLTLGALMESGEGLSKEHGVDIGELMAHGYDLLSRFENKLLCDTVERVGKDTARKLSRGDRICGAIALCQKHNIKPVYLTIALAAGLLFAPKADAESVKVSSFAAENGVKAALNRFCSIDDKGIIGLAEQFYSMLKNKRLQDIVFYAERLKAK